MGEHHCNDGEILPHRRTVGFHGIIDGRIGGLIQAFHRRMDACASVRHGTDGPHRPCPADLRGTEAFCDEDLCPFKHWDRDPLVAGEESGPRLRIIENLFGFQGRLRSAVLTWKVKERKSGRVVV